MAEPKGRPRTLVRRHILEIKEDTREWLEEQIATLKNTVAATTVATGAVKSVGEILKGAVSHPIGIAMVGAFLTSLLIGYFGGKGEEGDELIDKVKEQMHKAGIPVPDVFFEVWDGVYEVSRYMFPFLPVFPTVGSTPPIEPPTPESRKTTECERLNTEWQKANRDGRQADADALFQEAVSQDCLWATSQGR